MDIRKILTSKHFISILGSFAGTVGCILSLYYFSCWPLIVIILLVFILDLILKKLNSWR